MRWRTDNGSLSTPSIAGWSEVQTPCRQGRQHYAMHHPCMGMCGLSACQSCTDSLGPRAALGALGMWWCSVKGQSIGQVE